MIKAIAAGLITFIGLFVSLRAFEYGYHRLHRTPDWSPHWGSWVFALLAGLDVMMTNLGR